MSYSKRIQEAVRLMEPGRKLADIGCDHGYLCIQAIREHKFLKAVAADINPGPLSKACENIGKAGAGMFISTVISDGFSNLEPDFDCAAICGMGGLLIKKILEDHTEKWRTVNQLILGPHSEIGELRIYLTGKTNFEIRRESVVSDGGKFYVLLDLRPRKITDSVPTEAALQDEKLLWGDPLKQERQEEYLENLLLQRDKIMQSLERAGASGITEKSAERVRELKKELDSLKCVLNRK